MTRIAKRSLYQTPNRNPSRATLESSSPFRASKIIINVNSNLHKLYYSFHNHGLVIIIITVTPWL